MIQTALLQNAHSDLVTDAAYDMYGLYLATCSLDQRIKVWELVVSEHSSTWTLRDDWKGHDATVTKLSWAHPTFGTVLASASFDRTVKIWEQVQMDVDISVSSSGNLRWFERAVLLEAKGSVRAIEFAPHHFGLKIATVSSDNHLRVYECFEQPSLSSWQLVDEVDVPLLPTPSATNGTSVTITLAPGTPNPALGGGSALDSASVSNILQATQQQNAAQQGSGRPGVGIREADGAWCLSWCKERYWGEILAVGCGVGGIIKIVQFSSHRRPQVLLALEPTSASAPSISRHTSRAGASGASASTATGTTSIGLFGENKTYAVTSVAWAPNCGRSFHLIATGSRDGHVRIWKLRPPPLNDNVLVDDDDDDEGTLNGEEKWSASLVADFDDHRAHIGRVEWNITGTILSSSGIDGKVRLWKQMTDGIWRPSGSITVEEPEDGTDVDMDESIAD